MRIFKITEHIEVVCDSEKTRSGFRHLATLMIDGNERENDKVCYQNRTWERFEFQSVLIGVVNKANKNKIISNEERELCMKFAEGDHTDWSAFKLTSGIAKLGDLFCDNQKDKNDWKARMLKAGLGNSGLDIPEDWDTLDEDTKQARLDGVIKIMSEKGVQ